MATENKPHAKPEPWYPFNSGPPKDKVAGEASADGVKSKPEPWYPFEAGRPKAQPDAHHAATAAKSTVAPAAAAPTASPADFNRGHQGSATAQMDKLLQPAQPGLIDRIKPEADVIRHAYEPAKPLVDKPQVALKSEAKPHAAGGESHVAKHDAKHDGAAHAPVVARVHVHPPARPRSQFGEVLHAEAKELNRANGVIGTALAQGLHPDAIKAVVENRLHGHARDLANNVLAGATDTESMASKLADSQKVASALQAAASKAVNADHAEVLVASRLKGDVATAGVSAVQALAGPAPSITVSEQQLAASAPALSPGVFDLPELKVASQPDAALATAVAQQNVAPEPAMPAASPAAAEQPQVAAAEAAGVVTQPVPMPESQPLPMGEQPQVASAEPSGVTTYPVPMPEVQSLDSAAASFVSTSTSPSVSDATTHTAAGSFPTAADLTAEDVAKIRDAAFASPSAAFPELAMPQNQAGPDLALLREGPDSGVRGAVSDATAHTAAGSFPSAASMTSEDIARIRENAALTDSPLPSSAVPTGDVSINLTSQDVARMREVEAAASPNFAEAVAALADSAAAGAGAAVKPEVSIEDRSTWPSAAAGAAAGAMGAAAQSAHVEVVVPAVVASAASAQMAAAVGEGVGANVAESVAAAGKPEVVIEERSTQGAPAIAAKNDVLIEDRSTTASLADAAAAGTKMEAPSSYSNLVGDKVRDAFSAVTSLTDAVSNAVHNGPAKAEETAKVNDTLAAAGKPEVSIEERSTFAAAPAAPAKPEVTIEDRSTGATLADASAVGTKMESQSSYSNFVGDKLRDAFSAATSLTDTVSHAVQGGLAKGEEKLHDVKESVAQVIQAASSAGAKVSLEDALTNHMQTKGFDAQSIAAAGEIAQAIRQELRMEPQPKDSMLVLHKEGAELVSLVQAKDVASVARPGDSVLAMDTLEKVAAKGMDSKTIQELRGAMPEAVQNRSDLELAQSVGPAKSEMKGLDQVQNPQQEAQKQEKSAAAEQSRDTAAAMSMG
jgi:hypothetical protein